MTETSAPTDQAFATQTWGAISWRRAHRLDSPEDQAVGFKAACVFTRPQFQWDVERCVNLMSNSSDWVEPYSFEVVPFDEQEAARDRKLATLAAASIGSLPGPSRPWRGD